MACIARNAEKLRGTVEEITAAGGTAEAFSCDVTQGDSVQKTVDAVLEKWEKLQILVNNAGITRDTLIPRMQDEQWDEVINTNLRGRFFVHTRRYAADDAGPLWSHHQHRQRVGFDG